MQGLFNSKVKCFGKQRFMELSQFNSNEFVAGDYEEGGTVTFVLEILVTNGPSRSLHSSTDVCRKEHLRAADAPHEPRPRVAVRRVHGVVLL